MKNKLLWVWFYIKICYKFFCKKNNKNFTKEPQRRLFSDTYKKQLTLFPYCEIHDWFYTIESSSSQYGTECTVCKETTRQRHDSNLKLAKRYVENGLSTQDVKICFDALTAISENTTLREVDGDNWFCVWCRTIVSNKNEICQHSYDVFSKQSHRCVPVAEDLY